MGIGVVMSHHHWPLILVIQVDIAPTLALLFGVPIPKNSVGVLIAETFNSLTDDQQLRALELNSWQLLRVLRAQLPDLSCTSLSCDVFRDNHGSGINKCSGSVEETFCCLYLDAVARHKSWKSKKISRTNRRDDYSNTVVAYHHFLRTASEWLSRRVTDKPVGLLASGVAAMLLSCLVLLGLVFRFSQEVHLSEKSNLFEVNNNMHRWPMDGSFILAIILILVLSMGSSSLVEEEQYIWHFLTSTFYFVLLRKTLQSNTGTVESSLSVIKGQKERTYIQMCSIIVILISGRVLRGWHQGGVNWTHLPDISKWLEQAGSAHIKLIQLVSGLLVISLSLYALSSLWSRRNFVKVVGLIFLFPGLLVLQHIIKYQDGAIAASNYGATRMVQIVYAILGIFTVGTLISLPWLMPLQNPKTTYSRHNFCSSTDVPSDFQSRLLLVGFRDTNYVIGWGYTFCWCLLQLLLQQPINSMPMLLLLIQILASMCYSSNSDPHLKQWVEVSALYYLGMAGHFGLGNTNTLATIDVAGAFIGISNHSTLLSGILMFTITYASPMLTLLSMVMYISVKDTSTLVNPQDANFGHILKMTVGFPCLVPLCLNSVFLIAYTIILLLMRNHLFVWSVFSPKYLYSCATTACVYIGVSVVASTGIYTCLAFDFRKKLQGSSIAEMI